jgi:streptomycin 6-kinase
VNTVRVIAKLEPGGAQLSMLRVMAELGRRDIASELLCAAIARVLSGEHAPPPPLRSFTERYEPARAADVYESTYRALIAPLELVLA